MINKLCAFSREYEMLRPGDHVICAVSGGADSMALLWAMYLLRDKLDIRLSAAHFNHHLRGNESDEDEAFVREFCDRFQIPLYVGSSQVIAGKKGLEAAARDARYAYLRTLPGKIATAHTADDNAETVLMHLIRGTGLKGLGAIAPINGSVIRPMLNITRQEILTFLQEYHISYREDSSNRGDDFLRNRLRHHVIPLLKEENPRLAENLSAMAQRLRWDEEALCEVSSQIPTDVQILRNQSPALRSRVLERLLKQSGVREPEAAHIALAEALVFSDNPSAKAVFPGGVCITRVYDRLEVSGETYSLMPQVLPCPGSIELPQLQLRILAEPWENEELTTDSFTVCPQGQILLRSRCPGDEMRLSGGTKSLKKLFTDRKIPAATREHIPVLSDDRGVLGVYSIGANLDRAGIGVRIRFVQEASQSSK